MKVEIIELNNKRFIKTTPSENYILRKVGTNEEYVEALDLESNNYIYEEILVKEQEVE